MPLFSPRFLGNSVNDRTIFYILLRSRVRAHTFLYAYVSVPWNSSIHIIYNIYRTVYIYVYRTVRISPSIHAYAATATGWTGGGGWRRVRRRTASGVPFAYRGNLRKTEWLADILVCGEYAACTRRAAGRTAGNAHIILSPPKGTSRLRRRRPYPKLPLPYHTTVLHVFPYYILYTYTCA